MATAAFKSKSKRSNDKASPNKQAENQKQRLRRSLSVSAKKKKLAKGVGQSVVRSNSAASQMENGDARSVSRPPFQSEAEQESRTGITYGGRSGSIPASSTTAKLPVLGVKSFDRRSAHPSRHPSLV
ncbi:hypothetical protein Tco_1540657 [Tanacetum coccineum]